MVRLVRAFGRLPRTPGNKSIFDKYFVQAKLVVQEVDAKQALNNPGADKFMEKLGGTDGLPFYAFLDAHGALLVNCQRPTAAEPKGENIGFPVEPKEVEWFLQMIQKAAPKISPAELDTIEASLKSMANAFADCTGLTLTPLSGCRTHPAACTKPCLESSPNISGRFIFIWVQTRTHGQ